MIYSENDLNLLPGTKFTTKQNWFRYCLGAVLVTSQCLKKCWHGSLGVNGLSVIPPWWYIYTTVRLYVFHTVFMYITFASDVYMYVYTYLFPFKTSFYVCVICHYTQLFIIMYLLHYVYLCYLLGIFPLLLPVCFISLYIYWFMYWTSGTNDHLMLFDLQCTDYR